MSSSFEQGTEWHLLTVATPQKCLPADSFRKKFRSHVDSKELKAIGVHPIDYTSNSFKLGGQKCLVNGVVSPNFSKNPTHPNPVSVGNSQFPVYSSRKRTFDKANPNTSSKFRTTFNPKVSVIQETRKASSVPEATVTSQSEKIQAFRDQWDKVKENIFNSISQSNPVPDSPPIQNVVSESSQEASDDIWSQTTELLERVKA